MKLALVVENDLTRPKIKTNLSNYVLLTKKNLPNNMVFLFGYPDKS